MSPDRDVTVRPCRHMLFYQFENHDNFLRTLLHTPIVVPPHTHTQCYFAIQHNFSSFTFKTNWSTTYNVLIGIFFYGEHLKLNKFVRFITAAFRVLHIITSLLLVFIFISELLQDHENQTKLFLIICHLEAVSKSTERSKFKWLWSEIYAYSWDDLSINRNYKYNEHLVIFFHQDKTRKT